MSSLDKNSTTNMYFEFILKYDFVYRTNATASLLLKSQKHQEENKMPPSPFRWLICDTTAVVFSLFYKSTNEALTLCTQLAMRAQISEWGFPVLNAVVRMLKMEVVRNVF